MARFKAGLHMITAFEPTVGRFLTKVEPRPVCWIEVSLQPGPEGGATSLGHMHKDNPLSVKAIILWACELGLGTVAALMKALLGWLIMMMLVLMMGIEQVTKE